MENDAILEMKNITKTFPGVKALDDVSLTVNKGSVHALMGENGAGKSTLMNCLFGIYSIDNGQIIIDGQEKHFSSPAEALNNHVAMVHQELNQVLDRSVMENLWLGRFPEKTIMVDERKMYDDTKMLLAELAIDIDPLQKLGDLPVSMRQMVEIVKAISYDAKIVVMDEPTSSLTDHEVEQLFKIIDLLKKRNTCVIYISHRMEEILRISDQVTIMRDGKHISTDNASELTTEIIIQRMVGRELKERFPKRQAIPSDVVMEVSNITTKTPCLKDVSFQLRRGEILGISGLVGSKRTEVLETLFGLRHIGSGSIRIDGKEIVNHNPAKAIKRGFALITEERRSDGIFADLGVDFNMIISSLDKYKTGFVLRNKLIKKNVAEIIKALNIRTASQSFRVGNLSGGNQQKVIIGKWLLKNPEIFLMDEPTRGIDVGAKHEIYNLMNRLTADGKSIIMVSSEMPELIGVCDRIVVMSNGLVSGVFEAESVSQEQIMEASAKYV